LIRALEQDPDDQAARANLELVLRETAHANERDVQARIEAFLRDLHPR